MSDFDRQFNNVAMLLSAVVFVFGGAVAVNNFVTPQAIEAQGILGQAANFEEYKQVSDEFQTMSIVAAAGFAGMFVFGVRAIVETLKDLAGE